MAIYIPPLCRKKQVHGRYNPDTFRVISTFAEETHPTYPREQTENISDWRQKWRENEGLALPDIYNRKTEVLPHEAPDYRIHKPHPGSCGFLRHNVRLLNEPICTVFTDVTRSDQRNWWPSRVSDEPLHVPPHTKDTIYREDFQEQEKRIGERFGSLRHTANPNNEPALGAVPVNFLRARNGRQRLFKENISYEHIYNSRVGDNYPIRGKRQGSFVWSPMNHEASSKFIDHYQVISAEEGLVRQQCLEAEKKVHGSSEIGQVLNETGFDEMPMPTFEPVVEQAMVDTSLPTGEAEVPKAELDESVGEPKAQKSASPKGSKKSSPKHSPQHSPKQGKTPKSSPKQSAKCSRKNSKDGQYVSPPKSPVIDTTKLDEAINKLDISNVVIPQNTEEAQITGG